MKKFFSATFFALTLIFSPFLAYAQGTGPSSAATEIINKLKKAGEENATFSPTSSSDTYFILILARGLFLLMSLLGIVAMAIVLYAGYLWFTAGGDEGKVEDAKAYLKNGVIGLLLIAFAYSITAFVMGQLVDLSNPPSIGTTPAR